MPSPKKTISPVKRPKINQKAQRTSPNKTPNNKLQNSRYFCHYSNAVYMGGMDFFKRTGYGLMLTDNGACAITCYNHDNMVDHNVIFRDRSLTSIIIGIHRNKNICFRSGPFLLNIYMSNKDKAEGIGYFVHYRIRKIYKLRFDNGNLLIKQRITDQSFSRKVFEQNNLSDILDQRHIDTIKMNLKLPQEIKCIAVNETYMIGFSSKANSKNIIDHNGLCFKITVKQANFDYDVILQQRGYIERGVINIFGERHFDNGNYYVGQFKLGKFHGQGILIFPKEMKWTFGKYENGQLQQVIDSSVNSKLTCQDVLLKIHQLCKPYFKNKIQFCVSQSFLYTLTKFVDQKDPFENQSIEYTKQEEKKIQNLKTIQDDYTNKKYDNRTQQVLKEVLANKNKKIQVSNVRAFIKGNDNIFKQQSFGNGLSESRNKRVGSLQRRSKSKSNSDERKIFQRVQKQQNPQTKFYRESTNKSLEKEIYRKSYNNQPYQPQQYQPSLNYQIGSRILRSQQMRPDLYQYQSTLPFAQTRRSQVPQTIPPTLSTPPPNFPNFPNPFAHANFGLTLPSRQYRNEPIRIQDTPIHSLSPQMLGPLQFQANRLRRMHTDLEQSRQVRNRDKSSSPSHSRVVPKFKYLDEENGRDYIDNLIRQRSGRLSNDRYRNTFF